MSAPPRRVTPRPAGWMSALGDAFIIVGAATAAALVWNTSREQGLPLIPEEPPVILVPCPEPVGDASPLAAADVAWDQAQDLIIDARPDADFQAWHAPRARQIVYDFLDPVSDDALASLVSEGSSRVVVYGDGGGSDTGKQLAQELSGRGLRHVQWVVGGAPAARQAIEGARP